MVHPKRIAANAGGRPGDVLVLTKPLGVGIVTTAAKQDSDTRGRHRARPSADGDAQPRRGRGDGARARASHACTDVTGFGLLGHLRNLTAASGCAATVRLRRGAGHRGGVVVRARGDRARRDARQPAVPGRVGRVRGRRRQAAQLVLCDAQTSGGLLIAVAPGHARRSAPSCGRAGPRARPSSGSSSTVGRVTCASSRVELPTRNSPAARVGTGIARRPHRRRSTMRTGARVYGSAAVVTVVPGDRGRRGVQHEDDDDGGLDGRRGTRGPMRSVLVIGAEDGPGDPSHRRGRVCGQARPARRPRHDLRTRSSTTPSPTSRRGAEHRPSGRLRRSARGDLEGDDREGDRRHRRRYFWTTTTMARAGPAGTRGTSTRTSS